MLPRHKVLFNVCELILVNKFFSHVGMEQPDMTLTEAIVTIVLSRLGNKRFVCNKVLQLLMDKGLQLIKFINNIVKLVLGVKLETFIKPFEILHKNNVE